MRLRTAATMSAKPPYQPRAPTATPPSSRREPAVEAIPACGALAGKETVQSVIVRGGERGSREGGAKRLLGRRHLVFILCSAAGAKAAPDWPSADTERNGGAQKPERHMSSARAQQLAAAREAERRVEKVN